MTVTFPPPSPQCRAASGAVLEGWFLARALAAERASRFPMLAALAEASRNRRALLATILALHPWPEIAEKMRPDKGPLDPGLLFRERHRVILRRITGVVPGLAGAIRRTGGRALDDPNDYERLVEILTTGCRASRLALEKVETLTSPMIRALSILDPAFIRAGLLGRIGTEDEALRANAALAFLQSRSSTDLRTPKWRWVLERLCRCQSVDSWLTEALARCADRLPAGPLNDDARFQPIADGPRFAWIGRQWRNCMAQRVLDAANGTRAYYTTTLMDMPVILELGCLTLLDRRFWILESVNLHGNADLPLDLREAAAHTLSSRGIGALGAGFAKDAWKAERPLWLDEIFGAEHAPG